MKGARLVLENGRVFSGRRFGAEVDSIGEVVFNTALSGYQEILTDPSYAGQIVVMTAPEIGNVGVNAEDAESSRPVCAGFVIRSLSPVVSNWRAEESLSAYLGSCGIAGVTDIDTRALTRVLRDEGAMRGLITDSSGPHALSVEQALERVRAAPTMAGQDLVPAVSCTAAYEWTEGPWVAPGEVAVSRAIEFHVVAIDFGVKRNILRGLVAAGCRVTVVPAATPASDILALEPDGIFLSNGPGDPAAVTYAVGCVRELVAAGRPIFGICLGHQILSLALGASTFKLQFGHHGGNHPVKDLATGRVEITSQNHGFAVDDRTLPEGLRLTHVNLYDQTVEGIEVVGRPIFSVQYHPEASPGPHDAHYLFDRFVQVMRSWQR